jgi:hypothetical protein
MAELEESMEQVLRYLADVPRDKSGFGWTDGDQVASGTGLDPADINDAVSLLVDSGNARWLQALGSHPWRFKLVAITPRGRAVYQRGRSTPRAASAQAPVTINIRTDNFSGVAAGAVSGQTTVVSHQNSVAFDPKAVRSALDEVKKYRGDLGLATQDAQALDREIEVVDVELAARAPDQSRVRWALKSIKEIVEGGVKEGAKTVIARGIVSLLAAVI